MSDTIPVLFDTDIGSDIDDAVALAYLLRQPRCELLGITTVTGDVAQRAACAEVICRAAGKADIPIHCGIGDVLAFGPGQPHVPQYEGIRHLPHRTDWRKNTAVDFLRKTIRSRPGEITLLTVGPFANVAVLFALDPELPGMLKQWVSMSGWFFAAENRHEWNCVADPVSTAMAYRAAGSRATAGAFHASVGLDVTLQCKMPANEVRRRFIGEPLATVLKMAEVWFGKQGGEICFHDPLAATLLFNPGICQYQTGRVAVTVDSAARV
ncbi:MAG TPA: nucleoside hydrolase, partial [Tepidisphaeraceae bacterium]|nr:nucleoside hydrolase [Tepidisphaeraceae bacterium]